LIAGNVFKDHNEIFINYWNQYETNKLFSGLIYKKCPLNKKNYQEWGI